MNDIDDIDVQASIQAIVETYVHDTPNSAVCVADGHGIKVDVEKGHLEVHDGLGEHRRVRRYSKAGHKLARVVVLGSSGYVSLRALQWCQRAGIAVVVMDPSDSSVLSTSAACAVDDGRIRRAQALAMYNPTGLRVAKFLIEQKLAGQSQVVQVDLGNDEAARSIQLIAAGLSNCESVEDVRHTEAVAANVYWLAWESLTVPFIRRDLLRIPEHWTRFSGRRSAVNPGTARSATSPITALQNYAYRLVEAEARLATLTLGLDVGLGVLHSDERSRDGFALDVMEVARPIADRYVAKLLRTYTFQKRDFSEDDRGVVRVLSPLSHRLAEAMPAFAAQLAPTIEQVASMLADASPYDLSVPTKLSGEKHKSAARRRQVASSGVTAQGIGPGRSNVPPRQSVRQRPRPSKGQTDLPLPVCKFCGKSLEREADRIRKRGTYCPQCLAERRREIGSMIQATPKAPRRTSGSTIEMQSAADSEHRLAEQTWELVHADELFDRASYLTEIQPGLQAVSLTTIAKATGLSTSAASKIRSGKRVPHPRWWAALRQLTTSVDADGD